MMRNKVSKLITGNELDLRPSLRKTSDLGRRVIALDRPPAEVLNPTKSIGLAYCPRSERTLLRFCSIEARMPSLTLR